MSSNCVIFSPSATCCLVCLLPWGGPLVWRVCRVWNLSTSEQGQMWTKPWQLLQIVGWSNQRWIRIGQGDFNWHESVWALDRSCDALDTDDEAVDPSFDLRQQHYVTYRSLGGGFFVLGLDRDDQVSLCLFLCFQMSKHFGIGTIKAAELAGLMVGRSERTIRNWRSLFSFLMMM